MEAKKRRIDATLRRIISENFAAVPVAHHTVSSSSDSEAEPFTPVCDHFYYYLRPHHLASIASRFENDERGFPVEFVRSALSFASFPLFLQFSVCISDEKGHHLTPEKFNEFPVSYEQFGYNQEASKIGTESDPIASTNGIVATLKLTRFALPVISNDNAYLDGYGDDRNAILNERDSYIDLLVKSIQDFLNGEIIDGILDLNLQSPTCLLLMEKTLFSVLDNSLTPSVSSSNNSTSLFSKATSTASSSGQIMYSLSALPLEFVRKSESGIRTLQTEFQRHLFSNVNVKKVDNFFLMTVDPSLATASDSALFDNSHHSSKIWLLVTFSEEKLQASLLLFSKCAPESERMLLLESSKRGILECMQRVNRLVLLSELRETHTAR